MYTAVFINLYIICNLCLHFALFGDIIYNHNTDRLVVHSQLLCRSSTGP